MIHMSTRMLSARYAITHWYTHPPTHSPTERERERQRERETGREHMIHEPGTHPLGLVLCHVKPLPFRPAHASPKQPPDEKREIIDPCLAPSPRTEFLGEILTCV